MKARKQGSTKFESQKKKTKILKLSLKELENVKNRLIEKYESYKKAKEEDIKTF